MAIELTCPSCQRRLRVPDELLGKTVRCPSCQSTFAATANEPAPPPPPPSGPWPGQEQAPASPFNVREEIDRGEPPPPRAARRERERDEDEYDDRGPRRRGRGRDDYDEDYPRLNNRSSARSAVAGPAIALMVVSIIALALSLFGLVVNLIGLGMGGGPGALAGPGGGPGGPGANLDPQVQVVLNIAGVVFGMIWWSLILFGAVKMKGLQSRGLAMMANIMALIPCGIQPCCMWIFSLPFGIWGLVALSRPDVKDAFR